jgi:predicted amidophosphoribosyltransferase
MARSPRGTCAACGQRRVLFGGLCASCVEQEEFGRQQHEDYLRWLNERPATEEE